MGFKTKAEAEQDARKTLARMETRGWKIKLDRNELTGWWYFLQNGPLSVHYSIVKGRYFCMLARDSKYAGSGLSLWHVKNTSRNPNKSILLAVRAARKVVDQLDATVKQAEKIL